MLRKILLEEYAKIDSGAVREKSDVVYTVGLVQKNYDEVVEAVGTEDERTLYDFVKEAFWQTKRAFYPHGVLTVRANSEEFKESVSLDWIKKGKRVGEHLFWRNDMHPYCLTEKGREIYEDYKKFKENLPKEAR